MARIGIAGLQHETNTFSETPATFPDFVEADAWPGLSWREDMGPALAGRNIAAAGMLDAAVAAGHEPVALCWASASPSGRVTRDAFEALWWLFERALRDAGPIDALLLDLHGAMVVAGIDAGDAEWLRRVRSLLPPHVPVVAVFDFHANVCETMAASVDLALAYRTYPHIDAADCGRRAVAHLPALLAGHRYALACRTLPFHVSLPWQSTLAAPMDRLVALAAGASAADDSVVEAMLTAGFPLADVAHSGPAVVVHARTQAAAEAAADRLFDAFLGARAQFRGRLWTAQDAVAQALRVGRPGAPVILADTQDNPGGGADGDNTVLLQAMLQAGLHDACLGVLCDADAAAAAHAAGVGARLEIGLGGKLGRHSGKSVEGPWTVQQLGCGRFIGTGPFYGGSRMDLGAMACLVRGGVRVLVSSRKQQAADQAMFRHLDVEPVGCAVLALKSSVHFRADFGGFASQILVVSAGGANAADLSQLAYVRCARPPA